MDAVITAQPGLTFLCPAQGRALDKAGCRAITTSPVRNIGLCQQANCACSWRICKVCIAQGHTGENNVAAKGTDGLCRLHFENGGAKVAQPIPAAKPNVPKALLTAPTLGIRELEKHNPQPPTAGNSFRAPPKPTVAPQAPAATVPQEPVGSATSKPTLDHPHEAPTPTLSDSKVAPKTPQVVSIGRLIQVPCEQVIPLPGQPRETFDEEDMASLTGSIARKGQLIPALLVEVGDDAPAGITHQIVNGERRWRVCTELGIPLKGIIYDGLSVADAQAIFEASVVTNFNQSHHTPIEIARAAQRLIVEYHHTQGEVAEIMGMSVGAIAYHRNLLKLAPEVIEKVGKGNGEGLGLGNALLLLEYPPDFQREAAAHIVSHKLTNRDAAHAVRKLAKEKGVSRGAKRSRAGAADRFKDILRDLPVAEKRLTTIDLYPGGLTLAEVMAKRPTADKARVRDILKEIQTRVEHMLEAVPED